MKDLETIELPEEKTKFEDEEEDQGINEEDNSDELEINVD